MVKYFTNTFLATKVSFANEIYKICEKVGADYDKVIEYVPHGIDTKDFFPIREGDELYPKLIEFKKQTVPVETDFIVYFNSRNIHRKRPGDTLMAYKHLIENGLAYRRRL